MRTSETRVAPKSSIAWNDIEALPVYAAFLMGLMFLWFAYTDFSSSLQASMVKVIGIAGSLALRHAWLSLDDDADLSL